MQVETVHRITGPHLILPTTGAAAWLQITEAEWDHYKPRLAQRLEEACSALPIEPSFVEHYFEGGVAVALVAPPDLLYTACAVLEWATSDEPTSGELWDAIATERQAEERPLLRHLHEWAKSHDIQAFDDEDALTIGLGHGHESWPLDALPGPETIAQTQFKNIPIAYITGTNGKTTTTRMLARIAKEAGLTAGNTSSDGIVVDGEVIERGDWTGPGAARMVLRQPNVQVALLETARGGLMRRGLVLGSADVAIVTNISADHLGEWGLTDVHRLADAKLVVARGLKPGGILVVNADCPILMAALARLPESIMSQINILRFGFESKIDNNTSPKPLDVTLTHDALVFHHPTKWSVSVKSIPLTLGGAALHNVYNAAAAALAAQALGYAPTSIEAGLRGLKPDPKDSRGRANLYQVDDKFVLLDFAHNPGGLQMMAEFAKRFQSGDRYFLMGQAGDRSPQLIQELAEAAVAIGLAGVVVKNLPGHAYERDPDEVAQKQVEALIRAGQSPDTIEHIADEIEAAGKLIDRATSGSLTFLIAHEQVDGVMEMLMSRQAKILELTNG